jgi:ribosome-binding factor A
MATHRPERTGERLQEILARIVREELRDPRLGFLTITGVRLSHDLEHAVVFVSRIGSDEERKTAVQVLRRASGYLRRAVARDGGLRHTPELRFEEDASLERGARVEKILSDLQPRGTDDQTGGESDSE